MSLTVVISLLSQIVSILLLVAMGFIIFKVRRELKASQAILIESNKKLSEALELSLSAAEKLETAVLYGRKNEYSQSAFLTNSQEATFVELSHTLETLSSRLSHLPSTDISTADVMRQRIDEAARGLQAETQRLADACADFVQRLMRERKELSAELSELVAVQRTTFATLSESLRKPPGVIPDEPSTGSQRVSGYGQYGESSVIRRSTASIDVSPSSAKQRSDTSDKARFLKFKEWVNSNLPEIMSRSLNRWSTVEELLPDAPHDFKTIAKLLDPASKLIIIGTENHPFHLAIALPGGYIGSTFYDWFIIPKGTNVRVERTVAPAVVEASPDGYRVIERGNIAQD